MKIKICGLKNVSDILFADRCGADFVGFVLSGDGPRRISESQLEETAKLSIKAERVGVFVNPTPDEAAKAQEIGHLDIIQLHGITDPRRLEKFSRFRVWLAVNSNFTNYDFPVERLLLDNAAPGSGALCDQEWAIRIAERWPVMLAGGLTPENIAGIVKKVHPYGVDVSGGVESAKGIKSQEKIKQFIERALQ